MDSALQKEIEAVVKKLEAVKLIFGDDEYEKILADAAIVARDAMQNEAPESGYSHAIKDGSSSKIVQSGNLKRSIQVFKGNKKSKSLSALIGPVASKSSRIKKLKGGPSVSRKKMAYYWRFVYYGAYNKAPNRFIDRARVSSAGAVLATLKKGSENYLDKKIKGIFQ